MTAGNVLSTAVYLTGNKNLADKITAAISDPSVLDKDDLKEVEVLFYCYNLTISELSRECLPLKYKEDLTSAEKLYYYKDFSKTPLEIKSVYRSDIPIKFEVYPTYFKCDEDSVTVEYIYLAPVAKSLDDHFAYENTVIAPHVIAEGVAAEYLLNKAMFSEAIMWRDRYESSVKNCLLKRKTGKVKARGWY